MPARYSTLLLDADETLFDFLKAEQSSLETVLAARGLPHGAEILQRYHVINDALWHAFERGEITKEDYDRWRYHYPDFDDTRIHAAIPPEEPAKSKRGRKPRAHSVG